MPTYDITRLRRLDDQDVYTLPFPSLSSPSPIYFPAFSYFEEPVKEQ